MSKFEGIRADSKEYKRLQSKLWRKTHPIHDREQKRKWRKANPEKNLKCAQSSRHKHPIAPMLNATRFRAKKKGLEFNLLRKDIVIPEYCPVLGMKLEKGTSRQSQSPSLDRIDNTKGYIKGNVCVISLRANTLKSNASVLEIESILQYMKEHNAN